MARELTTIQAEIIENLKTNGILVSGSRTSIRRLWTYVIAYCMWVLENLFDLHKAEIDELLATEKASSLKWYREMALRYQEGMDLEVDSDRYTLQDDTKKIIKQAAVTAVDGRLRIKVVTKDSTGKYVRLSDTQKAAFEAYMNRVKDAGERLTIESSLPDQLSLTVDVWYNPLVLRANGARIDGTDAAPVKTAIYNYLSALPFNGEYTTTRLHEEVKKVEGVSLVAVKSVQSQFGTHPSVSVDERYIPDAGYLELEAKNLTINFKEYVSD